MRPRHFLTLLLMLLCLLPTLPVFAIGEVDPTPTAPPLLTAEAYIQRGQQAAAEGDYAAAIDDFTQALQLQPDNAAVYRLRAEARAMLEQYTAAVADFSIALEFYHYDWEVLNLRGYTYYLLGDFDAAQADYEEAIFRNPRYTPVFVNLRNLYRDLNLPWHAELANQVAQGLLAYEQGSNEDAINTFSRAIAAAPDADDLLPVHVLSAVYYNRALIRYGMGLLPEALEDYSAALDIFPQMHDAYLGRGIVHRELGDPQAAGMDFVRRMALIETEHIGQELSFDTPVQVEMAYGHIYSLNFMGEEGMVLNISARDAAMTLVDPLIVLLGPDGEALAGDDDFGGFLDAELVDVILPETGLYVLLVNHANYRYDGPVVIYVEQSSLPGGF